MYIALKEKVFLQNSAKDMRYGRWLAGGHLYIYIQESHRLFSMTVACPFQLLNLRRLSAETYTLYL